MSKDAHWNFTKICPSFSPWTPIWNHFVCFLMMSVPNLHIGSIQVHAPSMHTDADFSEHVLKHVECVAIYIVNALASTFCERFWIADRAYTIYQCESSKRQTCLQCCVAKTKNWKGVSKFPFFKQWKLISVTICDVLRCRCHLTMHHSENYNLKT